LNKKTNEEFATYLEDVTKELKILVIDSIMFLIMKKFKIPIIKTDMMNFESADDFLTIKSLF